jgi:serine/threonine protein kinase
VSVLASVLSWLSDRDRPTAEGHIDLTVRLRDVRRRYVPLRLLATGDVADIHAAADVDDPAREASYLLKVAHGPEGNCHLDAERHALTMLMRAAGTTTYRHYLPALADSFSATGRGPRRINVFRAEPGFHTLDQVHEQCPSLDGRHLAWIFKRLLTVLGFCHRRGFVHGAVLPCHVLIHAAGHGLKLVGWGHSVVAGRRNRVVSERYRDWYPPDVHDRRPAGPATDLFLAARCLVYLASGDLISGRMPNEVPSPMRRFVRACLLESAAMRPDDAWALLDDFDDLLRLLYGRPKFHKLTLT